MRRRRNQEERRKRRRKGKKVRRRNRRRRWWRRGSSSRRGGGIGRRRRRKRKRGRRKEGGGGTPGEEGWRKRWRIHLDEGDPNGSLSHVRFDLLTDPTDELVRDDKHQDLGSSNGLCDVRYRHLVDNTWYSNGCFLFFFNY